MTVGEMNARLLLPVLHREIVLGRSAAMVLPVAYGASRGERGANGQLSARSRCSCLRR